MHKTQKKIGFVAYALSLIQQFEKIGKLSAAEHLTTAISSFVRFLGSAGRADLSAKSVDSSLICQYEIYLQRRHLLPNTTSYYMRKLRAIYNRAVEDGLTPQNTPFCKVYTGIAKTRKRALPLGALRSLHDLDLKGRPALQFARDIFLFSFYTRGMSIVDIAHLRKSDLSDGVLRYRRRKTNRILYIRWEPKMQEIADRYSDADSEYLLSVIQRTETEKGISIGGIEKEERRKYRSAAHKINRNLKLLGKELGLTSSLTLYWARHSWASIAHQQMVPISVISQALGHDSELTTRIYLDSLDTTAIDTASEQLISLISEE